MHLYCLQQRLCSQIQIQSDLILPIPLPLGSLSAVTQEISGFFIVETHVLETTGTFRSEREVEELWEGVVSRLTIAVQSSLRAESDPDSFLRVKECLIGFIMTLEVHISLLCLTFVLMRLIFSPRCILQPPCTPSSSYCLKSMLSY